MAFHLSQLGFNANHNRFNDSVEILSRHFRLRGRRHYCLCYLFYIKPYPIISSD